VLVNSSHSIIDIIESMIPPIDAIRATEKFIASEVKMGIVSSEDACAVQLPSLVERIRNMTDVTMEQATEANEHLANDNGMFNVDQRREIATVIRAVVQSNIATSTSSEKTRLCRRIGGWSTTSQRNYGLCSSPSTRSNTNSSSSRCFLSKIWGVATLMKRRNDWPRVFCTLHQAWNLIHKQHTITFTIFQT